MNGSHSRYRQRFGARRAISSRSGSTRSFGYVGSSGPRHSPQIAFASAGYSVPHSLQCWGKTSSEAIDVVMVMVSLVMEAGDRCGACWRPLPTPLARLVFGLRWIDFVDPAVNPAGEVPHTREAGRLQLLHGLRASSASAACQHQVAISRECRDLCRE